MSPASRDEVDAVTARIGDRLAAVRTARKVRVSELARETGVSSSLISQIERGHSKPSVGTLFALARVLDVPVDTFFAEADEAQTAGAIDGPSPSREVRQLSAQAAIRRVIAGPVDGDGPLWGGAGTPDRQVVRAGHRASLEIRGGVRWERLTATALDGVEFLELVYAPGAESDKQSYRHPGVELVLVTQGVMTIFLGFEQYDLGVGDSISFPSSTPHRYVNLSESETRAVTVILRDNLSTLGLRGAEPNQEPSAPGTARA